MSLCFVCEDVFEAASELSCAACHRCFHAECAGGPGAGDPGAGGDDAFHCADCLAGIHRCGQCRAYAGEDDERHGIVRCTAPRCGLWVPVGATVDPCMEGRQSPFAPRSTAERPGAAAY